jgi:hypothetical protein
MRPSDWAALLLVVPCLLLAALASSANTINDVVSVSKSQDGKAVDHAATVEKGDAPSEAEVMNFWKGLTPEERFRYSLAATRDRPYVPIR